MTNGRAQKPSGHRKVHPSAYARLLSEWVVKYEGVPGVSYDKLYRVIGLGRGELTPAQLQNVARHFNWTDEQRKQVEALTPSLRTGEGATPGMTLFNPQNPLHCRVGELFQSAGFVVKEGQAILGADICIHLGPLLTYLEQLQGSAVVPNQFATGGQLCLDELYVELMAAENHRTDMPDSRDEVTRADPIHLWRIHSQRHRIPLATLLSRTEVLPAILFGDPGAGKSTLLFFALHDLARGVVKSDALAPNAVLPFRLSLRELALAGAEDDFEIIPYLVREILKVPEAEVAAWRAALGYLFRDTRPFRLFLLVDGVDEVTPNPQIFERIQKKLEDITSIARLVITSRRAGFRPPVRAFASFELVDLAEPAMTRLAQNWFTHVRPQSVPFIQSFILWIFADARRQEMAANPCLLSLLCYLNQDRSEGDFIQAVSRADLYRQAVAKLNGDLDRGVPTGLPPAQEALAQFALDRYARADGAPAVLFSRADVRQFFHEAGAAHRSSAGVWPASYLDEVWLRTRLVSCWDGGEHYHFIHLSFQEYFAACWLVTLPLAEVDALLARHRYNPYWREVWRFYAGLCRALGTRGKARFAALAKAYCEPRDLYDQTLFWLAPLCAEYGLNDTRLLLGFDLRPQLLSLVTEGPNRRNEAFVKIMADLDPEHFLDVAQHVLDPYLDYYRKGRPSEKEPDLPDTEQVEVAVGIIDHIYHPSALEYQADLIRAEMGWRPLSWNDPPLGPATRSGRNEALTDLLVRWLARVRGRVQQERLVTYLGRTGGVRAATAILQAARNRTGGTSQIKSADHPQTLAFQALCLSTLTDLQDERAVVLAEELLADPSFRRRHLEGVCEALRHLKHPAVASLFERLLEEEFAGGSQRLLEPILEGLKDWPERPVPQAVESILNSEHQPPILRYLAWVVLLRRTGVTAQNRLRQHLRQVAVRRRWSGGVVQEVSELAGFIGEEQLPFFDEIERLLERAEREERQTLAQVLWASLSELHSARARLPRHAAWLRERSLPALRQAWRRKEEEESTSIAGWLEAFSNCPNEIVCDLRLGAEEDWERLPSVMQVRVMQFFSGRALEAPIRLVNLAVESKDNILRRLGLEILAQVNPGRLVVLGQQDESIRQILADASVGDGTLFFETGFYSPRDLTFHLYAKSKLRDGASEQASRAES